LNSEYSPLTPSWLLAVILLLSAGSGVAALVYEVVWFQLLELVIGSSAVSLAVLLAMFMGGTGLGSLLLPRLVSVRHRPLKVYAVIEFGIGILGLTMLLVIPLVGSVYSAWSGYGLRGFLFRGVVAAACLLPPTFLMGATLPALARRVKTMPDRALWLGLLYGGNIAGAVAGCLIAGFYLLRKYDTELATYVASTINVTIGAIALGLGFLDKTQRDLNVSTTQQAAVASAGGSVVYFAIALSGFCALAAETLWTRALGLLFGSSVYTLSIILAVFLIGLGLGSSLGALVCRNLARPRLALGLCQLLLSAAIAWTAYNLNASLPYWPIDPSISSDVGFNFQLDMDRALWALLFPTLLWGASFPFAVAAVVSKDHDSSRPLANVYAANTLGAIAGALSAALLLVAWAGSQRAQQLLIALSTFTGLLLLVPEVLSTRSMRFRPPTVAVGIVAIALCGFWVTTVPILQPLLVAHGRFAATWVGKSDIIYAEEGLDSSVAVSSFPNGALTFHVAGKIQASSVPRDMRLQRMLGHLTTLPATNPRSVLVIGCGAGITAGAVSIDPRVEQLTIVEIEALVPNAAATYFGRQNFDVIGNAKVQVHIDDGRHYLLTTKERFDAITADPLDPWVKGAATLYTREFLELIKQRLNPAGVVTMYIQLFETNAEAVKSAVATFFQVFPHGTVWGNTYEGRGHDMVLMGQIEPLQVDLDEIEQRLSRSEYAQVVQSLREVDMNSAMDLFATYAGRGADLTEWLRGAEINRDRNLRMQYLAGFGLNRDDSAVIYADMLKYRRFPEGMFISSEGRVALLREAIAK
jgi:spermidine synthase